MAQTPNDDMIHNFQTSQSEYEEHETQWYKFITGLSAPAVIFFAFLLQRKYTTKVYTIDRVTGTVAGVEIGQGGNECPDLPSGKTAWRKPNNPELVALANTYRNYTLTQTDYIVPPNGETESGQYMLISWEIPEYRIDIDFTSKKLVLTREHFTPSIYYDFQ